MADSELLARLFRALGDATRLRVLELLLEKGELHQMKLVRRLGATQNRVSEHMSCLVWCGFVQSRIEGRRTLYRVSNRKVGSLLAQAKRFFGGQRSTDRLLSRHRRHHEGELMSRVEMSVDDMTCEHCETSVTAALRGAGATEVLADFRQGRASADFDGDAAVLIDAMGRAGYAASST